MQQPLVSILIPVYNGANSIEASIRSCLNQSYGHFELIIYNDGSTDDTKQLIQKTLDSRIIYIESTINQGIAFSRNLLLKQTKGEFIAWLDADDEMLTDRIEKQLAFFERNPTVDICGSWMFLKNTQENQYTLAKTICDSTLLKTAFWFKNYMFQPTVMSRNFYVKENIFYDERFNSVAEDYELWYRLSTLKTFANIAEPLINYDQLNNLDIYQKKVRLNFNEKLALIWNDKWKLYTFTINEFDKKLFESFINTNMKLTFIEIKKLLTILNRIEENSIDEKTTKLMIAYHQCRIFRNASLIGKFLNLNLLKSFKYFFEFKKSYIIS
jgi:glycosyltransferase involved in cell wall biosynthesis